jgi:PIN domain nuclease of toxin-antitoxin system
MNVLLDTCALLALARGELPEEATAALSDAEEAYVSTVSPWEVAIKAAAGKLRLAEPPFLWFTRITDRYSLREVQIDARIVCAAAELPPIHTDPFDRIVAALAQTNAWPVITSDQNIAKYAAVKTIW